MNQQRKLKFRWLIKYWVFSQAQLPMWLLVALTGIYAYVTREQWKTQMTANESSATQFRESQDATYKRFAEERDSTYRHFREAQDSETSHFLKTMTALLQQHTDVATVNEPHLVCTDETASYTDKDTTFQYRLHNSGPGVAHIRKIDYTINAEDGNPRHIANLLDTVSFPIPPNPGYSIARAVSVACVFLRDIKTQTLLITIRIYYADDFDRNWYHEEILKYDRPTKQTTFVNSIEKQVFHTTLNQTKAHRH